MIASVHISNFQSHKSTMVTFEKGVNVIIGPSDSGKTSVIRALNWVINNKPTGDNFISKWATECIVTVVLTNGDIVTRGKSKSDNYYMLNDAEFRAFGQDIPPEIREAFNMNELNVQFQMDAPFLLSNGSGEVAQILNKAVNLDVIDRSVSNIRKKKLDTDKELKFNENRLREIETTINDFSYLTNMENDVKLMEQLSNGIEYAKTRKTNLKGLIARVADADQHLLELSSKIRAEDPLQRLFVKNSCLDSLRDKKGLLEGIVSDILDLEDSQHKYHEILSVESKLENIFEITSKLKQLTKTSSLLVNLTSVWKDKVEESNNLYNTIAETTKIFDEEMKKQGVCVLCGKSTK